MDVTIRPHEPDDAEELAAAVDETRDQLLRWMPWCHPDYGLDDARQWIALATEGRRDGTLYDFAIVADGRFAGACGINEIRPADRVANLGYWVRRSAAGRGVASEAVRRLIAWGFEHTNLNRFEIIVATSNAPSLRVAEKVGAHRDAVLAKRTLVDGAPVEAAMYSVVRGD